MKSLTQYEIIGMAVSVIVAVAVLGVFKLFPLLNTDQRAQAEAFDDIISINVVDRELDRSIGEAIAEASSASGSVTKLIVMDVEEGAGRDVRVGDTASVHYIGTIQDGQQFDSSYSKGEPFTFTVGAGEVIEGWDRGIVGMHEGGKRIIVVPSSMAYGSHSVGPVPAHATLIFAIELLSIR